MVDLADPFIFTTEVALKLEPFIANVNPTPPEHTVLGEILFNVGAGLEMSNAALVPEVTDGAVAVKVYPDPDLSMVNPLKVAIPETVFNAIVLVPFNVAELGLFARAKVTLLAVPVTGFP